MQSMILDYTKKAEDLFNDEAANLFYEKLKEGKFQTTYCEKCHCLLFPPRVYCPHCTTKLTTWQDLPRKGTLHAWAQHDRGIRFNKPDVLGLVDLEGVPFRVLGKINVPATDIVLGQSLVLKIEQLGKLAFLTFGPDH